MSIKKELEIVNELGMHARAAGAFVKTAEKFSCEVKVARDGMEVNGKSIMGLMMLAAFKGSFITVSCAGADEDAAFCALEELICNKFGEGR